MPVELFEATSRPTPFHALETGQGIAFGEVGGWQVPIRSGSAAPSLALARESAALVDLTPWGRLEITGKDRKDLLQRIGTQDLRPLVEGSFTPTLFVTPKGRIVDRALVFDRGDSLLLLTAPEGRARLEGWIRRYVFAEDLRIADATATAAAFAMVGPLAGAVASSAIGAEATPSGSGRFIRVSREDTQILLAPWDGLPSAWIAIGPPPGIVAAFERAMSALPDGPVHILGCFETEVLRVEAGIPAEGHELTEEWNPWEARLEDSFSLSKGCYTGQEVLARLKTYEKVQRRLVGVRIEADRAPEPHQPVYQVTEDGAERQAGVLTSAVVSDRFGAIGLAMVRIACEQPGRRVTLGEARTRATVAALPFASR